MSNNVTRLFQMTPPQGITTFSNSSAVSSNIAIDGIVLTSETTKADLGLADVYVFKGNVPTIDDLPKNPSIGSTYNIEETGENYAWDGKNWDKLAGFNLRMKDNMIVETESNSPIVIDSDLNAILNLDTNNFKSGVFVEVMPTTPNNISIPTTKLLNDLIVALQPKSVSLNLTNSVNTYKYLDNHKYSFSETLTTLNLNSATGTGTIRFTVGENFNLNTTLSIVGGMPTFELDKQYEIKYIDGWVFISQPV